MTSQTITRRGSTRSRTIATLLALAVGCGTIGLAGCGSKTEKAGAVGGMVVDLTGSSATTDVRQTYQKMGTKAIDELANAKTITTIYFFDNQGAKLQPAGKSFDLFKAETDIKVATPEEALEERTEKAISLFKTTLRRPSGEGRSSDIVTAITQAANDLQQQATTADVDKKYLLVFTDGQQNTPDLDVTSAAAGGQFDASALVSQAKSLGVLANLQGVTVEFIGVLRGVTDGQQLSNEFESNLRKFWQAYVEATGGTLDNYGNEYDAILGGK